MELKFNVLPQPNVPNANNVVFGKEALDSAIKKYQTVINEGRAVVYSTIPKSFRSPSLSDAVGLMKEIEYDEESNSYIATMHIIDTLPGNALKRAPITCSVRGVVEPFALATNKIATFDVPGNDDIKEHKDMETDDDDHIQCNDPNMIISSTSLLCIDDSYLPDINNISGDETEPEPD